MLEFALIVLVGLYLQYACYQCKKNWGQVQECNRNFKKLEKRRLKEEKLRTMRIKHPKVKYLDDYRQVSQPKVI